MNTLVSRRRMIGITAAAAGLSLLPFGRKAHAEAHLVTWQGAALGATASLQIHHHDRAAAERLIERSLAEVRRLERIFSLYREDSALVTLNRQGFLATPPGDLVRLLDQCRQYCTLTSGVFDPTVQVLWSLYREHFSKPDAEPDGPERAALDKVRGLVGFSQVSFDQSRILFARRGMGLTLNGIAQGYITDRVVDIFRTGGIERSLVDMGESRTIGRRPDGSPWRIGIADADDPSRTGETLEVADGAVATSGSYGFRFDPQGRFSHLLDPRGRPSAQPHKSTTVITPSATEADALSTAFSLMTQDEIVKALTSLGRGEVRVTTASGTHLTLKA